MKQKSIERKILIPFLFVVIIPSLIIGLTSMWASYRSEKQTEIQHINNTLSYIEQYIDDLIKKSNENKMTVNEAKNLAKIFVSHHDNLYLKDENGDLYYKGKRIDSNSIEWINEKITGRWKKELGKESWVYIKPIYKWKWIIYYPKEFSFLSATLINIQKYTILIVMISSIIAIELTVFLSYSLSKPIKYLAAYCENIRKGNINTSIADFQIKRKDEIRVLANSIQSMVKSLDERNNQLMKMKQINEIILNHTHVGMVLIQHDTKKWISNFAADIMLKRIPLLKEEIMKLISKEDNTFNKLNEILSFIVDNEKVYYLISITEIRTENKLVNLLITFEDITERKKLENRMERIERLTSLGNMASGLAHEIRNPLTTVKMTVELLKRRLSSNKENEYLLQNILEELNRINQIMNHLLQLSRPIDSNPQKIVLDEVVHSNISLLKSIAEKQNIEIFYQENGLTIYMDLNHLRQILMNLIINAIQAIPRGGKINILAYKKANEVVLEITDTGEGIEEEILRKIFNPFFTTKSEGTGLGLAIVHQLVTQNHGEIDVYSRKNIGTTFRLIFPEYKEEQSET